MVLNDETSDRHFVTGEVALGGTASLTLVVGGERHERASLTCGDGGKNHSVEC